MKSAISILFLFIIIISASLMQACRHKPVLPDKTVSFTVDILPIIGGNCQAQGCHGPGIDDKQIASYDDYFKNSRIVPGNPYKSKIYTTITSQAKGTVMPVPPQSPLTDAQIQIIFIWIEQGALNN